MLDIHNKNHDFLLFNTVKKPVIAESITVISLKLAFKFFDISAKKGIFSELWIDNGFYFEIKLCIKRCFYLLKCFCLCDAKQS